MSNQVPIKRLLYVIIVILLQVPGYTYTKGYNYKLGDKNILWKKDPIFYLTTLRPTARDIDVVIKEMKKLKTASLQ